VFVIASMCILCKLRLDFRDPNHSLKAKALLFSNDQYYFKLKFILRTAVRRAPDMTWHAIVVVFLEHNRDFFEVLILRNMSVQKYPGLRLGKTGAHRFNRAFLWEIL
jgi:hypothetical protein